jgi:S1/P1 Nuclease
MKQCITLSIFLLFYSLTANAWNQIGHKVIADIAYQQLNAAAIKKVDQLVKIFHKEYAYINTIEDMSYWPDRLREQKIDLYSHWHYIDYAISLDDTPAKNNMNTDNVIWAINKIQPIIKNKQHSNSYEKARFLAFLIHTVADIHQPLHTASLFSKNHPDGDRGGNNYRVYYQSKLKNLHQIWDEGAGIFAVGNKSVYPLAEKIMQDYPRKFFGDKIYDLNPNHWALESFKYAKNNVYATAENQPLSENYISAAQKIAEQQAALAGYRLGVLLNQLLG